MNTNESQLPSGISLFSPIALYTVMKVVLLSTLLNFPTPNSLLLRSTGWPFGSAVCKISGMVQGISVSASVFTLVAIAVDR